MPFGQHQDRVLVLTKRHVGSGNEIAGDRQGAYTAISKKVAPVIHDA